MFKREIENTAPKALTDAQLELISGGVAVPGGEPGPTCPDLPPIRWGTPPTDAGPRPPNCGPNL